MQEADAGNSVSSSGMGRDFTHGFSWFAGDSADLLRGCRIRRRTLAATRAP